jgi:hypothetical protein
MDLVINHQSALWGKTPVDSMVIRYKNLRKAWLIILEDKPFAQFLSILHGKWVSLKLFLRYFDFRFLR